MARIGLKYPRYCPVTVTQNADGSEAETLGTGKVMGKAISANITVNAEPQTQYADDGPAESVTEFTGGNIDIEQNDLIDTVASEVLGQTIDADGDLVSAVEDNPPYLRKAFIVPKVLNGQRLYRAICYMRVKFAPPGEQLSTKGQNLTFGNTTLKGALMRDKDGNWKKEHTFDTLAAAMTWMNTKVNTPTGETPALTVTFSPADNATGVSTSANAVLTFSNPIDHGSASIVNAATGAAVAASKTFNGAKTTLTLDPSSALAAATEYYVVTSGIYDAYGQALADTAVSFTTA